LVAPESYQISCRRKVIMNEEESALQKRILPHFNNNMVFINRYNNWPDEKKLLFLRLANHAHEIGLDCFFIDSDAPWSAPIRFGRKDLNKKKASRVLIRFLTFDRNNLMVSLSTKGGILWPGVISNSQIDFDKNIPLDQKLIEEFEKIKPADNLILPRMINKVSYWPDDYNRDSDRIGDGNSDKSGDGNNDRRNSVGIEYPKNIIYYGPPGTGKTYKLNQEKDRYKLRHVFVTFHQSYGYEEFVEGLRPVIDENTKQVHYEIRRGVFLNLCSVAREDPNNQYAIIIDEINRGNVSKIFGELITLIETDKREKPEGAEEGREGEDQAISLHLAYSGKPFSVPSNVDIIGSMNTADRSLALIDTALRRRFEFIPMMPDTSVLNDIVIIAKNGMKIDVRAMLEKINLRIETLYDRDHTIGHAYFIGLNDFEKLKNIFRHRILPLLEEYFFDDWEKIRLVLGDNQKINKDFQFVKEDEINPADLFGENAGLAIQKRYHINKDAFDQPQAYKLIYEPD